ncbi:hypothetical protein DIQ79_07895 [Mycolicibacterium smegmatis]|uniref:Uncharacterized protein n=1 Tax=Mycolicibacterium smegmatis (strain ATCC 700084 / mc(2)155) TaxID=246196 RepID=A0R3M7_MYCS2|nr:hypothetical protein MSMEG_5528 [Mycolicibacterium smegmatis MC2 155]TBM51649.1 hypothetical protein DIQ86_04845 [Mycolicibacterium smegmatis]TBH49166.1 hypothetical protein EYS45_06415 [Mycolicibacterium smegmatis MC2 155]TBM53319.1 hypothetical protein DIQ85_07880 [Mycolicibacterium smegmatis]TBM65023.1 hypothetical protein DIQ83_07895 [Mycolicibacterium smegmatis]
MMGCENTRQRSVEVGGARPVDGLAHADPNSARVLTFRRA